MDRQETAPTLFFLSGATAVGKTELALAWAEARDAEIVSCDAVQFYRGMDIGSAKPSPEEQARVPHHLIDVVPVDEPFTVARYQRAVRPVIESIWSRGKRILVTGGSGFYLNSFFQAYDTIPSVPPAVRDKVRACQEQEGKVGLRAWLESLDPAAGEWVDTDNPVRLARAIERCLVTGQSLREQRAAQAAAPDPWAGVSRQVALLTRERVSLAQRIALRIDHMVESGLEEEVRQLGAAGILANPSAAKAIGYRETLAYQKGAFPDAAAWKKAMIRETRRLVRKQETWFRRFFPQAWAERHTLHPEHNLPPHPLNFVEEKGP